jgi:hypothetical protein
MADKEDLENWYGDCPKKAQIRPEKLRSSSILAKT